MIKISDLLSSSIDPLIHGALMSRIIESENNEYFAAVSSYQKSKKIDDTDFDFESYIDIYVSSLNKLSNSSNWISLNQYRENFTLCGFKFRGKEKAIFIIHNDLKITKESFYNKLYFKFLDESKYIVSDELNNEKKNFIRGFIELRGSIDTKRPYIAGDYFFESYFEMKKGLVLSEYLSVPHYVININFRELQNQFINEINKRNTQIRLQLNWYLNNIGLINDYKAHIVNKKHNYSNSFKYVKENFINYIEMPVIESRKTNLFIDRINYYSNNIFGKKLNSFQVEKLRNELGFDDDGNNIELNPRIQRNKIIVALIRKYKEDICLGCCKNKDLNDRTFTHRKYNKPYFEIHHNISLKNNIMLDDEDNLVKLCPVCHACLKKGVGLAKDQKQIISNILESDAAVKDFASNFFDTKDINELIDYVYKNLA